VVRVAQPARDRVLFGAQGPDRASALHGIERMRLALGVDQDLRPFYGRFSRDPLIGRAVRADPSLRVRGRPDPFEALAWAICEQLIEVERAARIQRRLARAFGRRCARTGLREGLSATRAAAIVRAAREVASGRVDLFDSDAAIGWRRLRKIRGIGSWTIQMLALTGQGKLDQLPAGDLAFLKLVGRIRSGGDPWARASEDEVNEFFAPYEPWRGLAGIYALRSSKLSVSQGALASG
jgi:3-methyladenine DNA glycosylase/8-oxoguanine DNA glycosylase